MCRPETEDFSKIWTWSLFCCCCCFIFLQLICIVLCVRVFLFEISFFSLIFMRLFQVIWSRWMWWVVWVCEWMFCVKCFKCKHNDKMKQFLFFRSLSFVSLPPFRKKKTLEHKIQNIINEENTTWRIGANSNTSKPTKKYPWTYAWLFVVCVCVLYTFPYICILSLFCWKNWQTTIKRANLHERVR